MSNPFNKRTIKGWAVVTLSSLRGILLVGDPSSADMWQYPPPCINMPIMGTSPTASRSMSEGWTGKPEPDPSTIW